MKTINVVITKDGNITMDAQGFKGRDCEKYIKKLLDGLGKTDDKKKVEYYQTTNTNNINIE